jgi:hypothetical protein
LFIVGEVRPGYDRLGQVRPGCARLGLVRPCYVSLRIVSSGKFCLGQLRFRLYQAWSGLVRLCQIRSSYIMLGLVR